MNFNNTEHDLLSRISRHNVITTESFAGRGPQGGKVSGGMREHLAGRSLQRKGILRLFKAERYPETHRGHTLWHVHRTYELNANVDQPLSALLGGAQCK
jgi:hypothetical protein